MKKSVLINLFIPAILFFIISINVNLISAEITGDAITGKASNPVYMNISVIADAIPPRITNIASSATSTTATITWITDESANSTVYYGTTTATTSHSNSSTLTTSHSITLDELSSSTLYYYNVSSCDYANNCNTSSQYSFTTLASSITPPPSEDRGGGGGGGGGAVTKDISIDKEKITIAIKQGQTKKEQITIKNTGNYKLTISLSPPKLENLKISETSFDLNPGEIKTIRLEFAAKIDTTPDLYTDKINVKAAGIIKQISIAMMVESLISLFDVKLEIPKEFLKIQPGKKIIAHGILRNLKEIGKVDVLIEYTIKDDEDFLLLRETETISVEGERDSLKTFTIPEEAPYGNYVFYMKATYNGEVASASAWFEVGKETFFRTKNILIIAIALIILTLIAIIYEVRKLRRYVKIKIDENVLLKEKLIKLKPQNSSQKVRNFGALKNSKFLKGGKEKW